MSEADSLEGWLDEKARLDSRIAALDPDEPGDEHEPYSLSWCIERRRYVESAIERRTARTVHCTTVERASDGYWTSQCSCSRNVGVFVTYRQASGTAREHRRRADGRR